MEISSVNLLINCIMNNTRLGYDKNSLAIFGDAEIIHLLEAFGVNVDERIEELKEAEKK